MDKEYFDYDTEPSCRAVVSAREWISSGELAFFEAVQKKFYFNNEDPKEDQFYQSLCEQFEIPYQEFLTRFHSQSMKEKTYNEFVLNRKWGVRAYPTVLFRKGEELFTITRGFLSFEEIKTSIAHFL